MFLACLLMDCADFAPNLCDTSFIRTQLLHTCWLDLTKYALACHPNKSRLCIMHLRWNGVACLKVYSHKCVSGLNCGGSSKSSALCTFRASNQISFSVSDICFFNVSPCLFSASLAVHISFCVVSSCAVSPRQISSSRRCHIKLLLVEMVTSL